jgi:DNA (cytosine-5)-methyltransferase 1
MFRIIKEFKPRWIIAENVRGIINIQDGVVFEGVHADLESQNYETQTFIIPAAGVGAPHRRDRVWVVANSRRIIRGQQSSRNKESIGSGTSQKTERTFDRDSITGSSEREKIMADSKSIQSNVGKINQSKKESGEKRILRSEVGRVSSSFNQNNWWNFEPNVGRVVDGVQGRTHRLKGLGNSIVPQIAEEIGKAILKAEHD